jgi:hypothetical protein
MGSYASQQRRVSQGDTRTQGKDIHLVNKDKVPYCIVRAWSKNKHGYKLYVVPADSVVEIQILETFNPG